MLEVILTLLPVIVVAAGVMVWGLRLEGLVKINRNNIEHLNNRVDRQDNEIEKRLAKIDGRLETIANSLERVIWHIPRNKSPDE